MVTRHDKMAAVAIIYSNLQVMLGLVTKLGDLLPDQVFSGSETEHHVAPCCTGCSLPLAKGFHLRHDHFIARKYANYAFDCSAFWFLAALAIANQHYWMKANKRKKPCLSNSSVYLCFKSRKEELHILILVRRHCLCCLILLRQRWHGLFPG